MSKKNHVRRQLARDRKSRRRGGATGRNLSAAMQEASSWPLRRAAMATSAEEGGSTLLVVREGPEGELVAAAFEVGPDGVSRAQPLSEGGEAEVELFSESLGGPALEDCEVEELATALERALQDGRRAGRQPPVETYALRFLLGAR